MPIFLPCLKKRQIPEVGHFVCETGNSHMECRHIPGLGGIKAIREMAFLHEATSLGSLAGRLESPVLVPVPPVALLADGILIERLRVRGPVHFWSQHDRTVFVASGVEGHLVYM